MSDRHMCHLRKYVGIHKEQLAPRDIRRIRRTGFKMYSQSFSFSIREPLFPTDLQCTKYPKWESSFMLQNEEISIYYSVDVPIGIWIPIECIINVIVTISHDILRV